METPITTLQQEFPTTKMLKETNSPRMLKEILGSIHKVATDGLPIQMTITKSGIITITEKINGDGTPMETVFIKSSQEITTKETLSMNKTTTSPQQLKNGTFGIKFCKVGNP